MHRNCHCRPPVPLPRVLCRLTQHAVVGDMRSRFEAVLTVLLCASRASTTAAATAQRRQENEALHTKGDHTGKKKPGFGFFQRAFEEAKRLGEALDPEAAAEVQKAWNDIRDASPELRQTADELIKAKDDLLTLRKEAGDAWSGVQRAVANADGLDGENKGSLELHTLAKDAAAAAKGVVGEVLGDVTSEIASSLESRLTDALSEGNIREASLMWRRLLDTPGVMFVARDRKLWAGAERAVRNYLQSFMSEESALEAERAVNATANYALHFAGLSQNADKSDDEVFDELSSKMCHLQGAAEKLWPLASGALPIFGYKEYISSVERAIQAHALSRLTLTVTAGALLGLSPRNDPFLMTLIASFSLGHLTKDVVINLAAFFQKAVVETSPAFQDEADSARQGNALDLAGELVGGTNTCHELGRQAFDFFQVIKRAISSSKSLPAVTGSPKEIHDQRVNDFLTVSAIARSPRKLGKDGWLLRIALWMASIIDRSPFSLQELALGFCIFFACFVVMVLKLWHWKTSKRSNVAKKAKKMA